VSFGREKGAACTSSKVQCKGDFIPVWEPDLQLHATSVHNKQWFLTPRKLESVSNLLSLNEETK
jgi:hypothetical protein